MPTPQLLIEERNRDGRVARRIFLIFFHRRELTMSDCSTRPDPFDPAKLRLSQDFTAELGVQKVLTTVPVRKPDKTWFVRVHPSVDYRMPAAVLELKEEREIYIVHRDLC